MLQYVAKNLEDGSRQESSPLAQIAIPPLVAESFVATQEMETTQNDGWSDPRRYPSTRAVSDTDTIHPLHDWFQGGFHDMPSDPVVALAAIIENAG